MDLESGVLALARRALDCRAEAELRFLLLNDSRQVFEYRQAALWAEAGGVESLSGVLEPERNAPYVQFLTGLAERMARSGTAARCFEPSDFPAESRGQWNELLPRYLLWLPFIRDGQPMGLLLAREAPFPESEITMLTHWVALWASTCEALAWRSRRRSLLHRGALASWRRKAVRKAVTAFLLVCVFFIPVPLTILAPGELVPARAEIVRAPQDGTLGEFFVQPNEKVRAGDALFRYDQSALLSRLEIAKQELATARAEYRQATQRALTDPAAKALLVPILGRIQQSRAEVEYLDLELGRSTVLAPSDGIVLMEDPSEWNGRPVMTGERILRLARLDDVEVEAWVGLGDALPLPVAATVTLYPDSSPLQPVRASLRYFSHEAQARPNGAYAYRIRATPLEVGTVHRVGTKGTARIGSGRVPLVYWLLRRPLAYLRAQTGW